MRECEDDRRGFAVLMEAIYGFYRQDLSDTTLAIWWASMRQFDLDAVREALNRHVMNPDTGQWLPKPADVVKMLGGTTLDAALMAWTKVDAAIRGVGSYMSVVFDDALIHVVIEEMGGWVILCQTKEKDYPFRANEFQNRYRAYRSRGELPTYPSRLIGLTEGTNGDRFKHVQGDTEYLRFIGEPAAAQLVLKGGVVGRSVRIGTIGQAVQTLALESPKS